MFNIQVLVEKAVEIQLGVISSTESFHPISLFHTLNTFISFPPFLPNSEAGFDHRAATYACT